MDEYVGGWNKSAMRLFPRSKCTIICSLLQDPALTGSQTDGLEDLTTKMEVARGLFEDNIETSSLCQEA